MSTQAIVPSGAGPVHEAGGRSAPDPSIPDPSIPDLSIIVPLFNEEDNVAPMYEAIRRSVADLGRPVEIVFVDDGSRDRTLERAMRLERQTGPVRLRIVAFRRNYGQTAAMAAGIEHARGRILITMDGDLQNDPADIPLFLAKIDEGYDLVVGWRHDRQDHWSRVLPSKAANWLIGRATGVPIKDNGCSLKAYRAELIKQIPLYNEMHRFIPAMSSLGGARIAEIKVRHHARRFGASKYGFSRIYKVFLDLLSIAAILAFNRRPMVWFARLTLSAAGLGLVTTFFAILRAVDSAGQPGIVFPGVAMLFGMLTLSTLFLGLLGTLVYASVARRLEPFLRLKARPIRGEPDTGPLSGNLS